MDHDDVRIWLDYVTDQTGLDTSLMRLAVEYPRPPSGTIIRPHRGGDGYGNGYGDGDGNGDGYGYGYGDGDGDGGN